MTAKISIHALREEGDGGGPAVRSPCGISIHALREEGDRPCVNSPRQQPVFLSTPSARRATTRIFASTARLKISIHALREEGDSRRGAFSSARFTISIHALREEGDFVQLFEDRASLVISIHALREEGDVVRRQRTVTSKGLFLSTPSARRATRGRCMSARRCCYYFYPRPPRGGRPPEVRA